MKKENSVNLAPNHANLVLGFINKLLSIKIL